MKKSTEVPEMEQVNKEAKAKLRHVRISARKARLVVNTIRYQSAWRAVITLMALKQKAARITEKLLKSAVANAKVLGMDEKRLYVSDIRVDGGPVMKRYRPRAQGRADVILKRMAHFTITLRESDRKSGTVETPGVVEKEKGSAKAVKKKAASKAKAAKAAKA